MSRSRLTICLFLVWAVNLWAAAADTTPPTIAISTPRGGTVYSNVQTVMIRADASDDVGVVRVEFSDLNNPQNVGTVTNPPYIFPWAVNMTENGAHSWVVQAYDAAGNVNRAQVSVTVAIDTVLIGWSDSGLQETDGPDTSVYSMEPAYSTVYAQLLVGGKLLKNSTGYRVTYEAAGDASGSRNATSQFKGSVAEYGQALYGLTLTPDQGLAGFAMPGPNNQPQQMLFDPAQSSFYAEGIPLTARDDEGQPNAFPLMRLVARNNKGVILASTEVALPVSEEMDCRACHTSGSQEMARPPSGWTWARDPLKDYKLNILRYHDEERAGSSSYQAALRQVGYNPLGLLATVEDGKTVLCLRCHDSNLLPGSGTPGMRPLTRLIHTKHAKVTDPVRGLPLDDSRLQSGACLLCHAGPESRYLRGAHRNAVNHDGALAMSCQNCHGTLTDLGAKGRSGWLTQPNCQSCHTGTATRNAGQLFYTNAFAATGQLRAAVDLAFATETNSAVATPRLFRAAFGHGGLHCAACHGPAHGEWPSLEAKENMQSVQLQGHVGALVRCEACHPKVPAGIAGGPHGLHPVGESWNRLHQDLGTAVEQCQDCHGSNSRGTALGLMQSDQMLTLGKSGDQQLFWRGSQIGCFNCHPGPSGQSGFPNRPPTVKNVVVGTSAESFVDIPLTASDPDQDPPSLRIVSQPTNGIAILTGNRATYFPTGPGPDAFTYAAWDGSTDSNLGTVKINVDQSDCTLTASALAPTAALPGVFVPFRANPSLGHCAAAFSFDWDFGDKTPHYNFDGNAWHAYAQPGLYHWKLTVDGKNLPSWTTNGDITISPDLGAKVELKIVQANGVVTVFWPTDQIPTALETSTDPTDPNSWQPVDRKPDSNSSYWLFVTPTLLEPQFFRVRRVP